MHFLRDFCNARLWCCIFISHTLLVTIWYTATFTITTLYSGRPRRWMSPLRWIMCRNKRGKRSSEGLLVILAKCLCTSHDLNESLDDRFFCPYVFMVGWGKLCDEHHHDVCSAGRLHLCMRRCGSATADVQEKTKNQIMSAIPGWSFFLSKIPGICFTVCTFTLWLMVKNGRSITSGGEDGGRGGDALQWRLKWCERSAVFYSCFRGCSDFGYE